MSQFSHPPQIKTKADPKRSPAPRMGPASKRAEEAKKTERANNATTRDPQQADSRRSADVSEKAEEVLSPRSELVKRAEAKKAGRGKMSEAELERFRAAARRMADTAKAAAEANIGQLDQHAQRLLRLETARKMRHQSTPDAVRTAEKERQKITADLVKRFARGEDGNDGLNQLGARRDGMRPGPLDRRLGVGGCDVSGEVLEVDW